MRNCDLRARIDVLKRAVARLKLLILGVVAAAAGFRLSRMVNVSFESNPVAWSYQWAVVLSLIGLAVWATAKLIGYPPPPSDRTEGR